MNCMHWVLDGHTPVPEPDVMRWAHWLETSDRERIVAQDADEESGILVSTVFLGLDHNFSGIGPPLLFETMVFEIREGQREPREWQDRYATWAEAEVGHRSICFAVSTALELKHLKEDVS